MKAQGSQEKQKRGDSSAALWDGGVLRGPGGDRASTHPLPPASEGNSELERVRVGVRAGGGKAGWGHTGQAKGPRRQFTVLSGNSGLSWNRAGRLLGVWWEMKQRAKGWEPGGALSARPGGGKS